MSLIMANKIDNINQLASTASAPARAAGDEVMELLHRLMHQYRALQQQALREGAHGITLWESKALGFFARQPGATQSDLAAHSGRDKAQLARLVKGLRDRGLLDGVADAADRRTVRIAPTAQGLALLQSLRGQAQQVAERAVAGLDGQEQAQLRALLARMAANLEG